MNATTPTYTTVQLDALRAAIVADEAAVAVSPYNVSPFVRAYAEAALWSSVDDNGNPLDDNRDVLDFAPETLRRMIQDCHVFQLANRADLETRVSTSGNWTADELNGYDLWLTRNGHGTGYWDRSDQFDDADVWERLSESARRMGTVDLYVGDDGKVYA